MSVATTLFLSAYGDFFLNSQGIRVYNYADMRKSTCYWRLKASYPDSFQSVGPGVRNNLSIIDDILHILNVFYINHIYIIFQYTILFAQIQSLYFTLKYKQNSNTTTLLQFGTPTKLQEIAAFLILRSHAPMGNHIQAALLTVGPMDIGPSGVIHCPRIFFIKTNSVWGHVRQYGGVTKILGIAKIAATAVDYNSS